MQTGLEQIKNEHGAMQGLCLLEQCKRNEESGSLLPLSAGKRKDEANIRRKVPWEEEPDDVFRKAHEGVNEMNDLKALTECAECTWDYIDRLRMALASACKERDELKKELAAMRNELCYLCGKYREAHNGACYGCRWEKR